MIDNSYSKEKGSALVLMVFVAVLLTIVGISTLSLGVRGRILAIRDNEQIKARSAADAGLEKAVYQMNEMLRAGTLGSSSLPYVTNESLPNTQSSFSYKVGVNGDGDFVIQSVGTSGQATKAVSATLRLKGLYEYSILTRNVLTMKSDTTVDAYNSSDLSDTDNDSDIATTSTSADQMILNRGVTVNGDIFVGVGGDPGHVIKDLGSTTGRQGAMTEEIVFPAITPPDLANSGNIDVKGTTLTIGPGDTGRYSSMQLARAKEAGVLVISGGDVQIHITGDVDMGQDCEIIINDDASLTMYLDGDLVAANNSGFNNRTKIPKKFLLYGTAETAQAVDLKAKSDLAGAVYAPNADIDLYASGDVYGSVVCDTFEFKQGGDFYFDEALRDVTKEDPGVQFTVKRWTED